MNYKDIEIFKDMLVSWGDNYKFYIRINNFHIVIDNNSEVIISERDYISNITSDDVIKYPICDIYDMDYETMSNLDSVFMRLKIRYREYRLGLLDF